MKTVLIDGVIGWDIYPRSVRRQLEEAGSEELDLQLASPGGFIYDGLEIFNLIRDYNEKVNKVNITIKGLAASMASYISLAVPKEQRKAEDNAVFMIHNAWSGMVGDYRAMEKEAQQLEAITNLLAKGYAKASNKPLSEIRSLMDNETWYYGDEIKQNGFISEIVQHKDENTNTKDEQMLSAKSRFSNMISDFKKNEQEAKNDLSKAAAMIMNSAKKTEKQDPASAGKNNTEVNMNLEELKKNHPELYAEVVQIGRDEEHDRVLAHITMGKNSGSLDIAVKHIESKANFTQAISAEYMSAGMKNQALQNRKDDKADTSGTHTTTDEATETKDYEAKLLAARGVKNGK